MISPLFVQHSAFSGYDLDMRFRKSFGLLGWLLLFFLCLQAFEWFDKRHLSHWDEKYCVFLAFATLFQAFSRYLVWWDIDSTGLHQRQWRSKKELTIAWDKVLCVRNAIPGVTWDGTVAVYFDDPGTKLGFRYLVTTPEQRKKFIAALREYAPNATFKI
jgi:hypothetical protein